MVTLEPQELLGHQAQKVTLVVKVCKVHRVLLDLQVLLVNLGQQDLKGIQEQQAIQVSQDHVGLQGQVVQQDPQGLRVKRDLKVHQVHLDLQELAHQDQLVMLDQLVHLETLVLEEIRDPKVLKVKLDHRVQKEKLVLLDHLDQLVQLAKQEHQVGHLFKHHIV